MNSSPVNTIRIEGVPGLDTSTVALISVDRAGQPSGVMVHNVRPTGVLLGPSNATGKKLVAGA